MERRQFLKLAGASGLALTGGGAWYTFAEGHLRSIEGTPYAAWTDWNVGPKPTPLNLVRAAILAASPHNTQPWKFLITDTSIELYLETARSVRGLDPYLREAHIGMGCALENLLLAADANGYAARVTLTDGALSSIPQEAALQRVARVDLSAGPYQAGELYRAIPHRHTNRSPYDPDRSMDSAFVNELLSTLNVDEDVRVVLLTDRAQRSEMITASAAANTDIYSDSTVENGSEEWIRWTAADVRKFEDGLSIDCFGLSPAATAMAKLAPVSLLKRAASPEHRSALYQTQMQSANLIGLITVRDRLDRRQCLLAGRAWQRAHLLATARGIAARPCNEAVEMIDYELYHDRPAKLRATLGKVVGDPSWQPTFAFLMGHASREAQASPRRPAESTVLRDRPTAMPKSSRAPGA